MAISFVQFTIPFVYSYAGINSRRILGKIVDSDRLILLVDNL